MQIPFILFMFIMIGLPILFIIWSHIKKGTLRRPYKIDFRKPHEFRMQFDSKHRCSHQTLGSVWISDLDTLPNGVVRVVGACVVLNAQVLKQANQCIRDGIIPRDNEKRQDAFVPGFKDVQRSVSFKGRTEYLYHRTHLIPYRYVLSEGDKHAGLLFAGTATLNMGAMYTKGYVVPQFDDRCDSVNNRVKELKRRIDVKQSPLDIRVCPTINKDLLFSMDDVERVSDWLIRSSPHDLFKYQSKLVYDSDKSNIPSFVVIQLINLTHKKVVFSIELPNQ